MTEREIAKKYTVGFIQHSLYYMYLYLYPTVKETGI